MPKIVRFRNPRIDPEGEGRPGYKPQRTQLMYVEIEPRHFDTQLPLRTVFARFDPTFSTAVERHFETPLYRANSEPLDKMSAKYLKGEGVVKPPNLRRRKQRPGRGLRSLGHIMQAVEVLTMLE